MSRPWLNRHLASPRHQSKIYPFLIESERCGVSEFKVVQNTMDDLMGKMRRLTAS
ncbi:hypothetical protein B0H16DRAFT_1890454 [Mycena metata]|uniref:Uncharacterized protein n=1 Tax=Mycena metata TaxID=1033252 RepID=A0AAD7IGZ3_9AGAR|nr:hypothetical protein B0H16DRAFT_1890454 [Mycena metata]